MSHESVISDLSVQSSPYNSAKSHYLNPSLFGSRHLFKLYLYLKLIFLVFHFKLDRIRGID